MVEEPGEEGRQEDVRVVVTSEEEKMVKSVEWSGATGVGMVEAEERGGPKENRKKKNQMSKHGGIRGRDRAGCLWVLGQPGLHRPIFF